MKKKIKILTLILINSFISIMAQQVYEPVIIANDAFPYKNTIISASEQNDKELLGRAFMARGEYYESHQKKREAMREYKRAFQHDSQLYVIANERIANIKKAMESRLHPSVTFITYTGVTNADNTNTASNGAENVQPQLIGSGGNTGLYNNMPVIGTNTQVVGTNPANNNGRVCPVCQGQKICISFAGSVAQQNKMYCHGKKVCQNCLGKGVVPAGYGQSGTVPCTYCNSRRNNVGDGWCGKCHGTGLCYRCNGKGYL